MNTILYTNLYAIAGVAAAAILLERATAMVVREVRLRRRFRHVDALARRRAK